MLKQLHVVIGRFKPVHRSHIRFVTQAAQGADDLVVILGSAHSAPTSKNPFSWEESAGMIASSLEEEKSVTCGIYFRPVRDSRDDNDDWFRAVELTVERFAKSHYNGQPFEVTLCGVSKPGDDTTWYLKRFPTWKYYDIPASSIPKMDATKVRDNLFKGLDTWERYVTSPVRDFLRRWIVSPEGRRLTTEYKEIKKEQRRASRYPYQLTYTTADAVVFWRGRILLIRRGGPIGYGLWALPGGFIKAKDERCKAAAKREASEEAQIELLDEWRMTPSDGGEVFDDPNRSLRGRVITHAYMYVIPDEVEVPMVVGGDDADAASWFPLGEIPGLECRLFEDHIDIIRGLTRKAAIPQPSWRPELGI
jgi:bifunctional NMN adenylyltransferase/nudix hydrolase